MRRILCLLSTLTALATPVLAQEKITIRMAHPPLALHELPLLVASSEGYFAEAGLQTSHIFMTGGNEAATALIAGNVDIINSSFSHPTNLRSKNIPVKFLCSVMATRDWGIVVDAKRHAGVKNLAELKGMRLAVPRRGSDGDQILRFMLEEAGLNPERDVQLIQIGGFANHLLAIEKGDVDGSVMEEPFVTSGVHGGIIKSIVDLLKGDGPPILRQRIFTGLIVSEDFLKNRRDVAEKMVRATKKAIATMYERPERGFAVAQKHFPTVPKDALREIYDRLIAVRAYTTAVGPEAQDAENKFLIRFGVIKKPVAYEEVVATEMSSIW